MLELGDCEAENEDDGDTELPILGDGELLGDWEFEELELGENEDDGL